MDNLNQPAIGAVVPSRHALANARNDAELEAAVNEIVCPPESYLGTTYWADLPFRERMAWVNKQSDTEARREITSIWTTFKKDPLEPFRQYWNNYVINGLGLFVEGYTLFSIGNLTSLFSSVWKSCWGTYTTCNKGWVSAVSYLEIIGIIVGQICVGWEADYVGRRFGAIQDALFLTLGTCMLIAAWGTTMNGWVICYAWSLFVYSFGVGGEYPITGTRTIEIVHGGREAQIADKLHRGRSLVLAFLMQGWGQIINQAVLIICLLIFHGGGNAPYSETSAQWTYRISFVFILIFTLYMLYLRVYKIKNYDVHLNNAKKEGSVSGYDVASLKLAVTHYGGRLIATAGCWLFSDFFFYGGKLFQSSFIKVIVGPDASVMTSWLYNLINCGVSLAGYYLASCLIDHKFYGRVRMQFFGFLFMFICFIIPAADYGPIQTKGAIRVFQFLYYMSSFFTQFGPNCTTFLVAAEVYPTSIRASAHGFSAACGKLGALAPAILFNYVDTKTRFWVVPWFGIGGIVLTLIFLPDLTGMDLKEQERYWAYVKAGRADEYHGIAVHPRHLSFFEHRILKRSANYDPEKDRQMRISETKALYLRVRNAEQGEQSDVEENIIDADDASFISEHLRDYFMRKKEERGEVAPTEKDAAQKEGESAKSKES